MPIIATPRTSGPTCRNCGCKRTGARCHDCGSFTGSFPVPATAPKLERRKSINSGIRRIYEAMFKNGALKRTR